MSTTNAPDIESSGNDGRIEPDHTDDDDDDVSTCPHGRSFCPVENPDARRDDALECFDCFVEA